MPWLTRGGVRSYRSWQVASRWLPTGCAGIPLRPDGPVQGRVRGRRAAGPLLAVAATGLTVAQFAADPWEVGAALNMAASVMRTGLSSDGFIPPQS
jgi:hypothetical protein